MTIAILRDNGDVLWFDAITSFSEQYSASVTKHPIATGGLISDHTIIENTKFSFSGILSDADFNLNRPDIGRDFTGADEIIGPQKQFINNTQTSTPVEITTSTPRSYQSYLPEVVAQYTDSQIPTVVITPQPKAKPAASVRAELISMFKNKERFVLLDLNTNVQNRRFDTCVIVGLTFNEDDQSGEALFPTFQIEQVQYTDLERTVVAIRGTAVPNKGRKTGSTETKATEEGDDPATEPTENSKKTAANVSSLATLQDDATARRTQ